MCRKKTVVTFLWGAWMLFPGMVPPEKPMVVHVFVALCDNVNQGIVPVPAKLGNGEDAANNLYWGAAYGVKTWFSGNEEWKRIRSWKNPSSVMAERCVFKHRSSNSFLVADAYRGKEIRQAITDFLEASAGDRRIHVKDSLLDLRAGSDAGLLAYVGHDGLMDFQLEKYPEKKDTLRRPVIILACYSKTYFAEALKRAGARPLVWATGLMAPEAYTLEAAVASFLKKESALQTREKAAAAYHQYQKCGLKAARNLLCAGE